MFFYFDEDVFQHDCTQHLVRFTYKSLYQKRTVALSSSNFLIFDSLKISQTPALNVYTNISYIHILGVAPS